MNSQVEVSARAALVDSAIGSKWAAKTETTLKQSRDGYVLSMEQRPIADGNVVSCRVRLFDTRGREVAIDPDRRIVNPPTQIVVSAAEYDKEGNETKPRVLSLNPEAALWEALWQSVMTVPR